MHAERSETQEAEPGEQRHTPSRLLPQPQPQPPFPCRPSRQERSHPGTFISFDGSCKLKSTVWTSRVRKMAWWQPNTTQIGSIQGNITYCNRYSRGLPFPPLSARVQVASYPKLSRYSQAQIHAGISHSLTTSQRGFLVLDINGTSPRDNPTPRFKLSPSILQVHPLRT